MTDPLPDAPTTGARLPPRLLTGAFLTVVALLIALERRFPLRYDSDDVAWQIALRGWRPGGGALVLPENTYLLHLPVILLGDRLLPSGPNALLLVSTILNLIGLALIVWVADRVVAAALGTTPDRLAWRTRAVTLAAITIAVMASPDQRLVMSGLTSRNLEIGVGLVIIHRATSAWNDRAALPPRDIVIGAGALALIGLDDPLLMYSIVVPAIALAVVVLAAQQLRAGRPDADARTRPCLLGIALVGVGGLVGWRALRLLVDALEVRQEDAGLDLVGLGEALGHVDELAQVWGMITAIDRIADDHWYQWATGLGVAALAAMTVAVLIRARPWPLELWTILAWPLVLSALYVGTTAGSNPDLVRYIAAGYPALGVVVAVAATRERRLSQAVVGFAVFTFAVACGTAATRRGTEGNGTYQLASVVERLAAETGTSLGYSGYWTSHIVTYYAGDPPTVLAEHCGPDGTSEPFEWITDLEAFDPDGPAPSSTFIIVDTSARALACPPDLLLAEHGEPARVIGVDDATEIWLYDRDVTADLTADP
jgi:hypothetical protein